MDNNYIDEMVRDSIGEYEMAFNPADWDVMEEHLEKDTRVRRKLYTTKAIEACLMLLTVWTIMQFVEIDNSASYQPTLIEHQENIPPSVDDEEVVPLQKDEKKQDRSLEKSVSPQNELKPLYRQPIAGNTLEQNEVLEIGQNDIEIASINNETESEIIDFKKIIDGTSAIPIASLETKMFEVSEAPFLKRIDLGIDTDNSTKKSKTRKYRVAGSIGTNVLAKSTSNDIAYLSPDQNKQLFNGIVGANLDRKLTEKLKLETGIILAYQREEENSSANSVYHEQFLPKVNTSTIEIPVNLLYEICSNEKNALYALGGLSNYFRLSVKKEYATLSPLGTNTTPGLVDNADRIDGLLVTKEMPDNHYNSVNVGTGYERKLNERLSLFAQATFKKSFGKLGDGQDDITTVSLSAGVKSIL